jgi:hypothetical protein
MSAAGGVMEIFELSIAAPSEKQDDENAFFQSENDPEIHQYGRFRVTKDFLVKRRSDGQTEGIHGIVIQEVKKKTTIRLETFTEKGKSEVYDFSDSRGDAKIAEVTNDQVQHMWSEYFEIFVIIDGKSFVADSFENGAICSYSPNKKGIQTPDIEDTYPPPVKGKGSKSFVYPYTYSTGVIEMVGRSRFFHMEAVPPVSTEKEKEELDDKIVAMLPPAIAGLNVGGVSWYTGKETPANGLPYLSWAPAIAAFLEMRGDSNLLTHTVIVNWNFPPHSKSLITNEPNFLATGGAGTAGGARSRRLRPRAHKRKTHRKRRQ